MQPWKHYWVHLPVAFFAVLGAATAFADAPSALAASFRFLCLVAGLYNAVLFGIGRERSLGRLDTSRTR